MFFECGFIVKTILFKKKAIGTSVNAFSDVKFLPMASSYFIAQCEAETRSTQLDVECGGDPTSISTYVGFI